MSPTDNKKDWGIWIVVLPCLLIALGIIGILAWQMYPRVTGSLHIEHSTSTWVFTPHNCKIALENGSIGILITASLPNERIRIHDGSFDTSSSTHAKLSQKNDGQDFFLQPNQCKTFDLKTEWRASSLYSDAINAVSGHLQLDCTDATLGHLAGKINFVSCELEEGTTIY